MTFIPSTVWLFVPIIRMRGRRFNGVIDRLMEAWFTHRVRTQVMWDDVIGEPEGIRSPECAWRLSGHCFRFSRGCCYVFLSVLVAPLLALCLGFTFACLAFQVRVDNLLRVACVRPLWVPQIDFSDIPSRYTCFLIILDRICYESCWDKIGSSLQN